MKLLSNLWHRKFNQPRLILIAVCVAIALIGFADATYLTISHYMNAIPPCTTGGCETVLTSKYSTIYGIPQALLGSLYYLAALILLILYMDGRKEIFLKLFTYLVPVGFIASLVFLYLQAFVIHAWCLYCLGSAATSTILFGLGIYIYKKYSVRGEGGESEGVVTR